MNGSTDILQEYLVKLGFKTDAVSLQKFDGLLNVTSKRVLGVGAAVAGMAVAVERGVAYFAGGMEKMHYSSRLAKSSVSSLQSLSFAAEQIGLNGEAATASVEQLVTALQLQPGTTGLLEALGVTTKGKEGVQVALDLMKRLKQETPMIGAMWAQQLLGMDQSTFLTTMANLDKLNLKYQEHKDLIAKSKTDMDQAAQTMMEYNNGLATTSANLERLGVAITSKLVPAFKASNELQNKFIEKGIEAFGDSTGPKKGFLGTLLDVMNTAGKYPAQLLKGESKPPAKHEVIGKIKRSDPDSLFASLEQKNNLPPGLLAAMWKKESGKGKYMLSPKGAQGHFGFMPQTASAYGLKDPNDLSSSATAAADLMRDLMREHGGDLPKALAGYNWGSGKMAKHGMENAPRETRDYIQSIMGQLGSTHLGASGGNITLNQKVDIKVSGSDADSTARAVGREQSNVGARIVRDMRGVQRS